MAGTAAQLERHYRSRSLWLDQHPGSLAPRPALEGDAAFDVAIVGAGFTGLWAAYDLTRRRPDLRVAVLEREVAGFGASGRNGGWVSGGIAGSWATFAAARGPAAVLAAERATYRAVDEIGRVVAAEGIDCAYQKDGIVQVATSVPQATRLGAAVRAARERGLAEDDLRCLERADWERLVRVEGARLAAYSPHGARVDPARLVRGLATACERAGVVLFERTEAIAVAPGRVRCRAGTVTAPHVLVATEAFTTGLPGEARRYLPLYSLMVATEPLPPATWEALGWRAGLTVRDRRHLFFYAQRTEDGRLAIGGRGAPYRLGSPLSEAAERDAAVVARLQESIRRCFPEAGNARLTHHWGGPLAVARDWCMGVGYDRATGLGWAGGYGGHGVVAANLAGRTLAALVAGDADPLLELPWVGHRARRWEPEPLRFLASRAIVGILGSADRHEDRIGRSARRTSLVAPFAPPA